jgi:hypothetical protein
LKSLIWYIADKYAGAEARWLALNIIVDQNQLNRRVEGFGFQNEMERSIQRSLNEIKLYFQIEECMKIAGWV